MYNQKSYMVLYNASPKQKELRRIYREHHRQEMREYSKKYREEHKEKCSKLCKDYWEKHKSAKKEKDRKYWLLNKDKKLPRPPLKDGVCIVCNKIKKIYCKLVCRTCYHKKWVNKKPIRIAQCKLYQLRYRTMAEDLRVETIQLVYEDNIKQYGTLTCYLCLKPIPFGKDHLEHKNPLSRGGSNKYDNLGVSCQSCNCKKGRKTVDEFLNRQKIKEM